MNATDMTNAAASSADADAQAYYDTWRRLAPLGLLAVGFGASLLGQATLWKSKGKTGRWVLGGTASLIFLNGGLCVFGEAVKNRLRYDLAREA